MATFKGVKLTVEDIKYVEDALRADRMKRTEGLPVGDPYYRYLLDTALRVQVSLEAELKRQDEAA